MNDRIVHSSWCDLNDEVKLVGLPRDLVCTCASIGAQTEDRPVVSCMPQNIWIEHRIRDIAHNIVERIDAGQVKGIEEATDELNWHAHRLLDIKR